MPFFFERDADRNILRICFTGHVSDPDLEKARRECALHFSEPRRASDSIIDFSQVESFEVKTKTIEQLAAMPPSLPPEKTAIIVAPRPHIFGMFRMLTLLSGERRPNLHVKRSMEEAYAELGIEAAAFRRLDARA